MNSYEILIRLAILVTAALAALLVVSHAV